jgi:hypothetical protein
MKPPATKVPKCSQPQKGTRAQDQEMARIIEWLKKHRLTMHVNLKGGVEFREKEYVEK